MPLPGELALIANSRCTINRAFQTERTEVFVMISDVSQRLYDGVE